MPLKVGKTVIDNDLLSDPLESLHKSEESVRANAIPNGKFLDDEAIFEIQDSTGEFLPNKKTSKSYLNIDGFANLLKIMKDTVNNVVCSMKSGDASALPLDGDTFFSACDYCENKAFCRRRK